MDVYKRRIVLVIVIDCFIPSCTARTGLRLVALACLMIRARAPESTPILMAQGTCDDKNIGCCVLIAASRKPAYARLRMRMRKLMMVMHA